MRVKKFEAKSMKEALQMVKQELGPDAVILAARDNRKNFGIGGSPSVEITAAVSEGTLQKKTFTESRLPLEQRAQFAQAGARQQRQMIDRMVEKRTRRDSADQKIVDRKPITRQSYIDIPDEVEASPRRSTAFERATGRNVDELLQDFDQDLMSPAQFAERQLRLREQLKRNQDETAPSEKALVRIRNAARDAGYSRAATAHAAPVRASGLGSGGLELVRDNDYDREESFQQVSLTMKQTQQAAITHPQGQTQGQTQNQTQNQAQSREVAKLQGEIKRLEQMLEGFQKVPQTFATMHPGADYGISYDYSFMFQKLSEAGISIENSVEILKQAEKEIDPSQAKKRPIIDAWVARWFLSNTVTTPTPFQGRLHLFVGGSGSGKTTSLVKMAAQLVVKEKKKVAVLSVDSAKVGSVDQMKIYCQILNVPFAVIRNKQDWEWIFSQLRHVDHILVDYPGMQLRDLDEIHLLKSLLPPEGFAPITHLCVSATGKDGDATELARRYKVAEPQDLIFTNLDQSVQHGIVYNLHRRTGLPLHSFGIGNRIPEDYEAASKERVLDLIFKLTKLRRETT